MKKPPALTGRKSLQRKLGGSNAPALHADARPLPRDPAEVPDRPPPAKPAAPAQGGSVAAADGRPVALAGRNMLAAAAARGGGVIDLTSPEKPRGGGVAQCPLCGGTFPPERLGEHANACLDEVDHSRAVQSAERTRQGGIDSFLTSRPAPGGEGSPEGVLPPGGSGGKRRRLRSELSDHDSSPPGPRRRSGEAGGVWTGWGDGQELASLLKRALTDAPDGGPEPRTRPPSPRADLDVRLDTQVVGLRQRVERLGEGAARDRVARALGEARPGTAVRVVREADNPADANACAVAAAGAEGGPAVVVGWLPRRVALALAPLVDCLGCAVAGAVTGVAAGGGGGAIPAHLDVSLRVAGGGGAMALGMVRDAAAGRVEWLAEVGREPAARDWELVDASFVDAVSEVLASDGSLFAPEEVAALEKIRSGLTPGARRLLLRLCARVSPWVRRGALVQGGGEALALGTDGRGDADQGAGAEPGTAGMPAGSVEAALRELEAAGLVTTRPAEVSDDAPACGATGDQVEVWLRAAPADKLRGVCKRLGVPLGGRNSVPRGKDGVVAAAMRWLRDSADSAAGLTGAAGTAPLELVGRPAGGGPPSRAPGTASVFPKSAVERLWGEVEAAVGPQVCVRGHVRWAVGAVRRLLFATEDVTFADAAREQRGHLRRAGYPVARGGPPLFPSRSHLLQYEHCLRRGRLLDEAAAEGDLDRCVGLMEEALAVLASSERWEGEGHYAGQFTPAHVSALAVDLGVSVLEKRREYRRACEALRTLLERAPAVSRRGRWWLRLSTNLSHVKDVSGALEAAESGVLDPFVTAGDQLALQKRVLRLGKPPRRWKQPPWAADTSWTPREEVIRARAVQKDGRDWGFGGVWKGAEGGARLTYYSAGDERVSVEDIALEHYAKVSPGRTRGGAASYPPSVPR